MNPNTQNHKPQGPQKPEVSANTQFDNADFIAGRVSRKERRKMEAAQSDATQSAPPGSRAVPTEEHQPQSKAFLGPTDDRETTNIPTYDPSETPQGAISPNSVDSNETVVYAYDADAGEISDGVEAQPSLAQEANVAWIPTEQESDASTISAAGSTEFVDPAFANADFGDSLTTTAEQPPVAIPPQSYRGGPTGPGYPDGVDTEEEEEKRSPLVLILSILLVAALLVIAAIAVWAYVSKDDPVTVPSPSVLEPSEEESSEPSLMPETQTPNAEPSQNEEAEPTEQPAQPQAPARPLPTTQQSEPPQPAPKPSAAPQPAPTADPQPPVVSATPDPAPSNP